MKTDVLLLGGSGLVGGALNRVFKKNNVRFASPRSTEVDLTQPGLLENYLSKLQLHENGITVILSAAITPYKAVKHDDFSTMMENIYMAQNTCTAMSDVSVSEIIYVSTLDVYEKVSVPITEATPLNPQSNYAITKLAAEFIVKKYASEKQIPALILRLSHVVGLEDDSPKVVNSMMESAINNRKITIKGDRHVLRDFVAVEDVAALIYDFAGKRINSTLNIATGKSVSLIRLAEIVQSCFTDRKIDISIDETPSKKTPATYSFDISNLRKFSDLQFMPMETFLANLHRHKTK